MFCPFHDMCRTEVALLAEGVDRNLSEQVYQELPCVALLAEGVDRNFFVPWTVWRDMKSPSSRRAWIEIRQCGLWQLSVGSPSSRRAWIEIRLYELHRHCNQRSPSSRRAWIEIL